MQRQQFHYHLPQQLIAQSPTLRRVESRLLVLGEKPGQYQDTHFAQLPEFIHPGDLLILNDTRVIPARLTGTKTETGGKVEVLVERIEDEHCVWAQLRASKAPKTGTRIVLEQELHCQVLGRRDDMFHLRFDGPRPVMELIEQYGHVPLPPYIQHSDTNQDRERYQTVYAKHPGAVAAPTAGLHFDQALLQRLEHQGVGIDTLTLHVGAGTFQPVRVDNILEHRMHPEHVTVSESLCQRIHQTRQQGGRVIAVGTTVVRALESATQTGALAPFSGDTSIFIYPGYRFQVVDGLLTNFHLPESTLLMLVCAFGGYQAVMAAYRHAVQENYRFFSYGDAMLLHRSEQA